MPWLQVSVAATDSNYQRVEDTLLSLGAQSITFRDAADNPILEPQPGETPLWKNAIITGLFDDQQEIEALREQLQRQLENDRHDISITILADRDWTRAWMDAFKPMPFGQRLWVCPRHMEPPDPSAINLRLDPGMAFGTGTHPTTSLCLGWLDAHITSTSGHEEVLDFGCGSGILAIAALLLGASHADCVDIDEQALQATLDNAATNHVANNISVYKPGELEPDSQYQLVLANILSGPLTQLAPTLARRCSPGSDIVLSGILANQAESVCLAYETHFDMLSTESRDEWVLLSGKRKAEG